MAGSLSSDGAKVASTNNSNTTVTSTQTNTPIPGCWIQSDMVTLFVGADRKPYRLHKDLLTSKSPYFATSLKDCWNGKVNEIELKVDNPTAFAYVAYWLYTERVDIPLTQGLDIMTLIVYNLADKLMIMKLKNDIIDNLIPYYKKNSLNFNFNGLQQAWNIEPTTSKFHQMVMRSCIKYFMQDSSLWTDEILNKATFTESQSLMKEVMRNIRDYNVRPYGNIWEESKCFFHDHSDGSKCD